MARKQRTSKETKELFRDPSGQTDLFEKSYQEEMEARGKKQVECLGMTFENDEAHSYHTKVPHKAIMRYILHYTESRDVVFDGFCGTGMTGVAAQLCGDRAAVESLGYQI